MSETPTHDQATQTADASPDLGSLSFSDYEKARRGESLPVSDAPHSARADQTAAQKKSENSEHSETEVEAESQDLDADDSQDDSESKDDGDKQPGKQKKSGWARRVEKLVGQREAEKKRADALEARLAALEAAGGQKPKPESKNDSQDGKPSPESFETHAEYVEALTDWKLEQKDKAKAKADAEAKFKADQESLHKSHAERVKAFAKENKDYAEVVAEADTYLPEAAIKAILKSEVGPALIYELAKNPDEAERIAQLEPELAAKEIGKLEAKIEAKAKSASDAEKKPEPKKLTQAPKPIEPVGKGKGVVAKSIDDPDISFADYEKLRREQMKRKHG